MIEFNPGIELILLARSFHSDQFERPNVRGCPRMQFCFCAFALPNGGNLFATGPARATMTTREALGARVCFTSVYVSVADAT